MPAFDAEKYWSTRAHKIFVVKLVGSRANDQKIVRARTDEGARTTALEHSHLKGRIWIKSVKLATPSDLGCQPRS